MCVCVCVCVWFDWCFISLTLFWHRANQSWVNPLSAERLARKEPVPMLMFLVWCDRGFEPTTSRFWDSVSLIFDLFCMTYRGYESYFQGPLNEINSTCISYVFMFFYVWCIFVIVWVFFYSPGLDPCYVLLSNWTDFDIWKYWFSMTTTNNDTWKENYMYTTLCVIDVLRYSKQFHDGGCMRRDSPRV